MGSEDGADLSVGSCGSVYIWGSSTSVKSCPEELHVVVYVSRIRSRSAEGSIGYSFSPLIISRSCVARLP